MTDVGAVAQTDKELAEKNKHIPNETIIQDIVDTEAEVVLMERGIASRKQFIGELKTILQYRETPQS